MAIAAGIGAIKSATAIHRFQVAITAIMLTIEIAP